jgi:hypothetical protein
MMKTYSMLWRRLDTPGHDACRFECRVSGWEVDGTAVFRHNGSAARLSYRVVCDSAWHTRQGFVRGFIGADVIDLTIERPRAEPHRPATAALDTREQREPVAHGNWRRQGRQAA